MRDPIRARRTGIWIALVLVGGYLLWPAFSPAHVEGFSASIASIGLHIRDGDVAAYDRLYPVNLEFFALSRLGSSASVALVAATFGASGDTAMRVIMGAGLLLLLGASTYCARQWMNAPWHLIAVALLLVPGITESAFFFNDNVLSAGLVAGALAMLSVPSRAAPRTLLLTLAAGILFGFGILARTDALIVCVAVPWLLLARGAGTMRPTAIKASQLPWRPALLFAAGMGAVLWLVPAHFSGTFIESLSVSRYVITLWDRPFWLGRHAQQALLFVGLPGAMLAAIGVFGLVWRRRPLLLMLLVGTSVVFNAVLLARLWQARQLLPLTPFVVALVALGLDLCARTYRERRFGRAAIVGCALPVLAHIAAPPRTIALDDGPRATRGRLWLIPKWRAWQQAVRRDFTTIDRLLDDGRATHVVITDSWNLDRYLHLQAQEHGFDVDSAAHLPLPCRRTAELFVRGDRRLVHLRLHVPFVTTAALLTARRLLSDGVPCVDALRYTDVTVLAGRNQLAALRAERSTGEGTIEDPVSPIPAIGSAATPTYEPAETMAVRSSDLRDIGRAYGVIAARATKELPPSTRGPTTLAAVDELLRARTRAFRGHGN